MRPEVLPAHRAHDHRVLAPARREPPPRQRTVLLAIPGVTAEQVDLFLAEREARPRGRARGADLHGGRRLRQLRRRPPRSTVRADVSLDDGMQRLARGRRHAHARSTPRRPYTLPRLARSLARPGREARRRRARRLPLASLAESVFAAAARGRRARRASRSSCAGGRASSSRAVPPALARAPRHRGGPAFVSPRMATGSRGCASGAGARRAGPGASRSARSMLAGRRAAFRRLLGEGAGVAANVWLVLPEDAVLRRTRGACRSRRRSRCATPWASSSTGFTPFSRRAGLVRLPRAPRATPTRSASTSISPSPPRAGVESTLARAARAGRHRARRRRRRATSPPAPRPSTCLPPERARAPAPSRAAARRARAGRLRRGARRWPRSPTRSGRSARRVIALHAAARDGARSARTSPSASRKEIEKLAAEHNFIVGEEAGRSTPAVAILEDLSQILPDTTWVQQLDIKSTSKGREVQIAGETGSSSQLIEVLEKSGILANASFKSPLTKGQTPNTERFLARRGGEAARRCPSRCPRRASCRQVRRRPRAAAPPAPPAAAAACGACPAPARCRSCRCSRARSRPRRRRRLRQGRRRRPAGHGDRSRRGAAPAPAPADAAPPRRVRAGRATAGPMPPAAEAPRRHAARSRLRPPPGRRTRSREAAEEADSCAKSWAGPPTSAARRRSASRRAAAAVVVAVVARCRSGSRTSTTMTRSRTSTSASCVTSVSRPPGRRSSRSSRAFAPWAAASISSRRPAASLSAAEIQDRVRQFIESAGRARSSACRWRTARDEGSFQQVTVTVQANANILVTRSILHALETNEPYLFVDSLMVRAQVPPGFKPAPGFEPEMFIQFDVSGYAIPGAGHERVLREGRQLLGRALGRGRRGARRRRSASEHLPGQRQGRRRGPRPGEDRRGEHASAVRAAGRNQVAPETVGAPAVHADAASRAAGRHASRPRCARGSSSLPASPSPRRCAFAFLREVAGGKTHSVKQGRADERNHDRGRGAAPRGAAPWARKRRTSPLNIQSPARVAAAPPAAPPAGCPRRPARPPLLPGRPPRPPPRGTAAPVRRHARPAGGRRRRPRFGTPHPGGSRPRDRPPPAMDQRPVGQNAAPSPFRSPPSSMTPAARPAVVALAAALAVAGCAPLPGAPVGRAAPGHDHGLRPRSLLHRLPPWRPRTGGERFRQEHDFPGHRRFREEQARLRPCPRDPRRSRSTSRRPKSARSPRRSWATSCASRSPCIRRCRARCRCAP